MRLLVLLVSVSCGACLGATCAVAQTGQWGQAEDGMPPYATHIDRRYGHDHVYPDRGAVVRDVPQGATVVNYAGISYRFASGVWYEPLGPAYIAVAPPIGLIVPQLPALATSLDSRGKTYFYANDVFYRPRPDLGGYVVANDPEDSAPERSQPPVGAPPAGTQASTAVATPQPNATPPMAPAVALSRVSSPMMNPTGIAIHPRNGQSADQQALDRYGCYRFAVARTGFDPLASNRAATSSDVVRRTSDYSREQAACLEGRGYTLP